MIINPYAFGQSYDPDAQAFITAAAISNTSQQVAINNLVLNLKSYGVWSKMKAVYPFVGGSAASHKWNLKDPQDTNAAYRLTFTGGWTHSSTGALPNGTNGYANTHLDSANNLSLNSGHMSFYSRTNLVTAAINIDMGSLKSSPDSYTDLVLSAINQTYFRFNNSTTYDNTASSTTLGFFTGSRTASNIIRTFRNGTQIIAGTAPSNATSSADYFIGASNNHGVGTTDTPQYYSSRECAFASIGDGLTDTEAANFYTAVQAFQVALGRSIGTQTVSDADAQAFINAAVIQDQIQANAVNQLVIDMKAASIWTKMKAVYPFVGGTATSHKWNLKDPQDTNAAFRLTFTGGWTHSSTGALPNGTNGYADTFFNALTNMSIIDTSFGVYVAGTVTAGRTHIGYVNSTNQQFYINIQSSTEKRGLTASSVSASYYMSKTGLTATTQRGFWAASNRSATDRAMICSDGSFVYSTLAFNVTQVSYNLFLGARNNVGVAANFDTMEHRFDFIGTGLNDTELTNLRTAVTTFNTTLGRNV